MSVHPSHQLSSLAQEVVYTYPIREFKCSLSGHFMRAPTGIYSGDQVCHIFEKRMIKLHLDQKNPKLCPTFKKVVKRLVSIPEILKEIKNYRKSHPELDDKESFNNFMKEHHEAYKALSGLGCVTCRFRYHFGYSRD